MLFSGGKKAIESLKSRFVYPAMLVTALSLNSCKSDKSAPVGEQTTDSAKIGVVDTGNTTVKEQFDSTAIKVAKYEHKNNITDDIHYDKKASIDGRLTQEMNALGPGFPISILTPITDDDSLDWQKTLALEFFYADEDTFKTGKNFKGYIKYFVPIFENGIVITSYDKNGYYKFTVTALKKGHLLEDKSIEIPPWLMLEILDADLKNTQNVIVDRKRLNSKIEIESFIRKIALANGIDIDTARNTIHDTKDTHEFYENLEH